MDIAILEGVVVALYERLGIAPDELVGPIPLARRWLGPEAVVVAPATVQAPACTFVVDGQRRIAVRPGLSPEYRRFWVAHELGHALLTEHGLEDTERAANFLAGALMAPQPLVPTRSARACCRPCPSTTRWLATHTTQRNRYTHIVFRLRLGAHAHTTTRMAETKASRAVKDWTREPGNTQTKLAERLAARLGKAHIAQSTISHIAAGRSLPRAELMLALKAELGIEMEWWLEPLAPASSPTLTSEEEPATGTEG